jgi:hypothetical protein
MFVEPFFYAKKNKMADKSIWRFFFSKFLRYSNIFLLHLRPTIFKGKKIKPSMKIQNSAQI